MIDKAIHEVYENINSIVWNDYRDVGIEDDYHEWYYAEGELYLIRDRIHNYIKFVKARSPKKAHEIWQDEIRSTWERTEE